VLGEELVHLEHISGVGVKERLELIIAYYLPLVFWVLQVVLSYVRPQHLHYLFITYDLVKKS
jgi:hypothetical protein